MKQDGTIGWIYFVTIIGAAVYFISQTHGFFGVLYALVKALFWPGSVLYRVMQVLHV